MFENHIKAIKKFSQEYSKYDEGDKVSNVDNTTANFATIIRLRFDTFDANSSALIQLEFNLTSIREAQKSTMLNRSMKRLTWVTFIFLPLVFVSGLFGMNVNALKNDPPWWWSVVFMLGTLSVTMMAWLVFKKFPDLEGRLDDKLSWFRPRQNRTQPTDVEMGMFQEGKKKVN